jgi:hypothetical protein
MTLACESPYSAQGKALSGLLSFLAVTVLKNRMGAVCGLKWLSRRIDIFSAGFNHG